MVEVVRDFFARKMGGVAGGGGIPPFSDGVLSQREEDLPKRVAGLLRLQAAGAGKARRRVERRRRMSDLEGKGEKEGQ